MLKIVLAFMVPVLFAAVARAKDSDPASVIIAMERAALDRSDKGDPGGFLEISAPDVTYFDPFLSEPIHGLEALREYYKRFSVEEPVSGVMENIKVQFAGDVAVLTFNYTTRFPKSGREVRWNTTEVYRYTKDGWRIIHTHWSLRQPKLAD
ncbi:MAG TPA: DUF3225 domain-containing protein [Acidobacteriota bacterium]|nr:DUF3225 domain-containing protein [Acidobacteriota bacterium]